MEAAPEETVVEEVTIAVTEGIEAAEEEIGSTTTGETTTEEMGIEITVMVVVKMVTGTAKVAGTRTAEANVAMVDHIMGILRPAKVNLTEIVPTGLVRPEHLSHPVCLLLKS